MAIRAGTRALFFLAIALSSGLGLGRITIVGADVAGLSVIGVALVLMGVYGRLAASRPADRPRPGEIPHSNWPIHLASVATDRFEVFSDRPEGYVGYTDYTAMSVDVNDDLVAREPREQYALLGFGNGFLTGIRSKLVDGESRGQVRFHVVNASSKDKEAIGWLAYLQQSGTDNAGPSTENLHSVIQAYSNRIVSNGPTVVKFWDNAPRNQNESPDDSDVSSELPEEWTHIYQVAFEAGRRTASVALIDPV